MNGDVFTSNGGDQNIGIGAGAIGQQINNILHHHHYSRNAQGIPLQRPAQAEHFKGRQAQIADLLPLLQPGKVVAVCGPGGMGKTAIAAQIAWQLAPDNKAPARFPDGIIFYSFYGKHSAEEALAHIVRSYDEQQQDTSPDAARRLLASKQALLILDGAEQADDLKAVLALRGACGVLITSRKKTDAPGARLDLEPLDAKAAAEAFHAYSQGAADATTAQAICERLGCWPVALRIAGHYLSSTGESAADYLRFLRQQPFKRLGKGEHGQENAALLLRRSVAQVSDDARLALGVAGCLAFAPLAREPLMAILDGDELRSCDALNELVNYGLLDRKEERWQTSHALIHTYAREELALSTDALARLAGWYIAFCKVASAEGVKGYARLDGERAHCLRLTETCLESRLWKEVNNLAATISIYLDRQGWWTEKLSVLEMNLSAAQQAGQRKHEGACLNNLGYVYCSRGEYKKALLYYEQCLPIPREIGDKEEEGATLNNIAAIYANQGKHELALEQYQQSLSITREIGDREGEGTTLNNIGMLYDHQGDYEQALQYYEQCLPIRLESGDLEGESGTINNIAAIYNVQGNPAKALEYFERALAICQQLGDKPGEAVTHGNIGLTYEDMDDLAKAEEYIARAVQLAENIDHPALETWRKALAQVRAKRQGQ